MPKKLLVTCVVVAWCQAVLTPLHASESVYVAAAQGNAHVVTSVHVEDETSQMAPDEATAFLNELRWPEAGLDLLYPSWICKHR